MIPYQTSKSQDWRRIGFFCSVGLRTLFVAGLALLMALLQIEFYAAHDILPNYRTALAFACELSLLSLPSMLATRSLNLGRWIVWTLLFGYIVASQGYHVYSGLRAKTQHSSLSISSTGNSTLENRVKRERDDKAKYEKLGAWDLVKDSRKKIDRLESQIDATKTPQATFGIDDERLDEIGTWLLVFVRAILPIVCALNVVKLRNDYQTLGRR